MKAKKIVTFILTAIVFFTAAFLGVSTVYRIEEVSFVFDRISEQANDEAAEIKEALERAYLKRSTITAKDDEAKRIVSEFSYFRLTSFQKDYPGRIVVSATEDAEAYAVSCGETYAIYSAEGSLLSVREESVNRADGKDNLTVFDTDGRYDWSEAFAASHVFCVLHTLDIRFEGIRGNVEKAELSSPTALISAEVLTIYFREGVKGVIYNPTNKPEEKAEALFKTYVEELSVADRALGTIYVSDRADARYER